jgi:hypothetical protein
MKTPSFLSPYLDGDSPTRLFQGLAVGIAGTLIIGFGYSGWDTGGTVTEKVESATLTAMVSALAPICADNFEREAKIDNNIVVKLSAVGSWERDGHLLKAGYVTFPGGAKPNIDVAEACAELLKTALKLK